MERTLFIPRPVVAVIRTASPMIVVAAVLTTVVMTSKPAVMRAALPNRGGPQHEVRQARERLADQIADAASGAHAVLLAGRAERGSSTDLLLWTHDARDPGRVNQSELLLISHSTTWRAVSVYRLDSSVAESADAIITADMLNHPNLCERFRTQSTVDARVLASGVSDLVLEVTPHEDEAASTLEIALIWTGNSADSTKRRAVRIRADNNSPARKEQPQ